MAIRELKKHGISFVAHTYTYEDKGGSEVAARELGVDEHAVIKTLVLETETKQPLVCLMHGDKEVSLKQLARILNVKSVSPCAPHVADNHSGYQVGGTSPFGTRKVMPIYAEESIVTLDKIYINGGKRGLLLEMVPADLVAVLKPTLVNVATS